MRLMRVKEAPKAKLSVLLGCRELALAAGDVAGQDGHGGDQTEIDRLRLHHADALNAFSSIMRSTFPCAFSGRELISSRNSVPPSADSTSPTFPSRLAPVKLLTRWYENLARQLDIPVFFIDTCYNPMDCVTETRVRYVRAQIDQLIRDLCAFTGKTWDDERFKKVMEISQRNSYLWERANNLMDHKPAPIGGFELFNYMSAMVCNRGKEPTTAIMEQLNAEMDQHIKEGTSTFPAREEYRVSWDGIPCASIEIDQQNAGFEQIRTRVQTFCELL